MDNKESLNEQMRRAVVEKMYLNYFNNELLEQGMITPEEHQKMLHLQFSGKIPMPYTPLPCIPNYFSHTKKNQTTVTRWSGSFPYRAGVLGLRAAI